ncbi:reverse transcriptase domain-containing protein [Tanacetum coccineum]
MVPSVEEVGGYSSDGSSRSRSRGRPRSAQKHQRGVSRKKGISKSHRSVRSEARSRSKSKSVKSKPQSMRASRMKSSSDSGYDIVSDMCSQRTDILIAAQAILFTSKITRFRYHRRASTKRPGKRYDKDPTEIHGIKRKPNEGIQAFIDRFKAESAHIKGVPSVRESGPSSEERRLQIQPKSSDLLGGKRVLIEEAVASGRLAQLVKDIKQGGQKGKGSTKGKEKLSDEVEAERILSTTGGVFKRGQLPLGGYRSGSHYGRVRENPNSHNGICGVGSTEKIVVNDNYPEQLVTIRGGLSAECRHALIHTLRKNVDIFAWTPTDMTGIPRAITEHSLDTYPHIEPKAQKKRGLPQHEEVVTKKLNEWLKAWYRRRMTKKYKEKTAFHTEKGVFCYTKMPFGLKTARATYQRLVDSAFKEQIEVNLEAYVDDMVIKSRTEQDIIKDIEQTFSTLRRINMKLNPNKCSFGMEDGKFLGYIVTSKGIRANPKKEKAVMDMPSLKTLKQMQSLSGKLAALNRFLSKSAERSLPFLDMLKKCTNKKDFRWTEAAGAAFLEIKKLVSELPTLTTPKKGETLMMYLAAANEAVSAVLLMERERRKMPIHYVS